jgi:heat shock protein HtpX
MIAALERLRANKGLVDESQPQLAAMKISGGKGLLFSSHPPLEDRIAALQRLQ